MKNEQQIFINSLEIKHFLPWRSFVDQQEGAHKQTVPIIHISLPLLRRVT